MEEGVRQPQPPYSDSTIERTDRSEETAKEARVRSDSQSSMNCCDTNLEDA